MSVAVRVDQDRADGMLGASDAAAALGLDPYTAPITVWRRLRGLEVDDTKPDFVREAAEWGSALEPIVRGKYALTSGMAVLVPTSSVVMDGWLRCTPDGFAIRPTKTDDHLVEAGQVYEWNNAADRTERLTWQDRAILHARAAGELGLYEGKTASLYKRDEWAVGVPAVYEIQCRVQMAVTKLPWCDVRCLVGGQTYVAPVRLERDAALEDRILTDLRAFWGLVQSGTEPGPDHTKAFAAHVSEKMRPSKVSLDVRQDDELAQVVQYWLAQRKKASQAKEEADAAKNDLLLRLSAAGATGIQLANGAKITAYRAGGRTDWKGVAISLGCSSAPEAYKTPGKTWTLRAPGDEDE